MNQNTAKPFTSATLSDEMENSAIRVATIGFMNDIESSFSCYRLSDPVQAWPWIGSNRRTIEDYRARAGGRVFHSTPGASAAIVELRGPRDPPHKDRVGCLTSMTIALLYGAASGSCAGCFGAFHPGGLRNIELPDTKNEPHLAECSILKHIDPLPGGRWYAPATWSPVIGSTCATTRTTGNSRPAAMV